MKKINIQIPIEEALDRKAILEIKYNQVKIPALKEKLAAQILDLETRIVKAISFKKYQQITMSKEYSDLYDANYEVFTNINKAKLDKTGEIISGYELDKTNIKRNIAKNVLCQKFCGEETEEVKIDGLGGKIN